MIGTGAVARPRLVWLGWGLLLLASCGVGGVKQTSFLYGAMGPAGGVVDVTDLRLTLPPGALAQPTTVAVVPQTSPLPVVTTPNDPCTTTLLSQWCCGPLGLALLQDAELVVHYDEQALPAGTTENDLLLLLWDTTLGAYVPAGAAAVQDTTANTFTVARYRTLGHVALAARPCPLGARLRVVFLGVNPAPVPIRTGATAPSASGLYAAVLDGSADPLFLDTGSTLPGQFLASPDGSRLLYVVQPVRVPQKASLVAPPEPSPTVWEVPVQDGATPTLLAGVDQFVHDTDPGVGWKRLGAGSRAFFTSVLFGDIQLDGFQEFVSIFDTANDGSETPSELHPLGDRNYPYDLRQSADGSMFLVVYFGSDESDHLDVFDAATGTVVSHDLIPTGVGTQTPRFLPDSSGVYLIDGDGLDVVRYDPDGGSPATLFTLPPEDGQLLDFVLAPNGDDYACVTYSGAFGKPSNQTLPAGTVLHVGSLSGGERNNVLLATTFLDVSETVFHPDGQTILLDTYESPVRLFSSLDATEGPALPVDSLSLLDVDALTGSLLFVVPPPPSVVTGQKPATGQAHGAEFAPGLWTAGADGTNATQVPLPADLIVSQARWLHSIRLAPGMIYTDWIR